MDSHTDAQDQTSRSAPAASFSHRGQQTTSMLDSNPEAARPMGNIAPLGTRLPHLYVYDSLPKSLKPENYEEWTRTWLPKLVDTKQGLVNNTGFAVYMNSGVRSASPVIEKRKATKYGPQQHLRRRPNVHPTVLHFRGASVRKTAIEDFQPAEPPRRSKTKVITGSPSRAHHMKSWGFLSDGENSSRERSPGNKAQKMSWPRSPPPFLEPLCSMDTFYVPQTKDGPTQESRLDNFLHSERRRYVNIAKPVNNEDRQVHTLGGSYQDRLPKWTKLNNIPSLKNADTLLITSPLVPPLKLSKEKTQASSSSSVGLSPRRLLKEKSKPFKSSLDGVVIRNTLQRTAVVEANEVISSKENDAERNTENDAASAISNQMDNEEDGIQETSPQGEGLDCSEEKTDNNPLLEDGAEDHEETGTLANDDKAIGYKEEKPPNHVEENEASETENNQKQTGTAMTLTQKEAAKEMKSTQPDLVGPLETPVADFLKESASLDDVIGEDDLNIISTGETSDFLRKLVNAEEQEELEEDFFKRPDPSDEKDRLTVVRTPKIEVSRYKTAGQMVDSCQRVDTGPGGDGQTPGAVSDQGYHSVSP